MQLIFQLSGFCRILGYFRSTAHSGLHIALLALNKRIHLLSHLPCIRRGGRHCLGSHRLNFIRHAGQLLQLGLERGHALFVLANIRSKSCYQFLIHKITSFSCFSIVKTDQSRPLLWPLEYPAHHPLSNMGKGHTLRPHPPRQPQRR